MVRVLIERKLKKREHISKMIREIRNAAMAQPGYISSETMVDVDDRSALLPRQLYIAILVVM